MPSSTNHYGWTYPISSDDLNAGATSIGSLATGIDASLYSEEQTRQGDFAILTASINNVDANKSSIRSPAGALVVTARVAQFTVTTDSVGVLSVPGGFNVNQSIPSVGTGIGFQYITLIPYTATTYFCSGAGVFGGFGVATNTAVTFQVVYW